MFFARAYRLFAYRGAMREELLIEQRNNEERGGPQRAPARQQAPAQAPAQAPRGPDNGERWVSPDEMKQLFPDLFRAEGGDQQ